MPSKEQQALGLTNEPGIIRQQPPPLPPRTLTHPEEAPPAYSPYDQGDQSLSISDQWHSQDPRSTSTQSLLPEDENGRRTLLLIYIHGFMGNETSFQSFPAHVHNLLTITLAETHTVHSKIYPRYKSRKAIEFARDDFSLWLEPHEKPSTDIILLGHSLGGILASEVALLPSTSQSHSQALRHRILGTISFDTPFLGMHPGVIVSGIGSLFRPAPDSPATSLPVVAPESGVATPSLEGQDSSSFSSGLSPSEGGPQASSSQLTPMSSYELPSPNDPNYNPPFPNDVRIVERKGWSNVFHFVNKHAEGLTSATKQYFMSHLEFGGCLADYPGMKARYSKIRHLEDVDEIASRQEQRVRFINYYTASTGRPKKPKETVAKASDEQNSSTPLEVGMSDMSLKRNDSFAGTPSISVPEVNDDSVVPQVDGNASISSSDSNMEEDEPLQMQHLDSIPMDDEEEVNGHINITPAEPESDLSSVAQEGTPSTSLPTSLEAQLPPLPPIPVEPELIDLTLYQDKDSRKVAEKEQKRVIKTYQRALKDRESAVKDRQKLLEKREKKARQEQDKQERSLEKQREKAEKERQRSEKEKREKEKNEINQEPGPGPGSSSNITPETPAEKPKRDRKFCLLPSDIGGEQDVCWKRVYMEGVDEVGAHCGLFAPGKHYEGLVGEVGNRIEEWVKEDATRRVVLEIEGHS